MRQSSDPTSQLHLMCQAAGHVVRGVGFLVVHTFLLLTHVIISHHTITLQVACFEVVSLGVGALVK